MSQSKQLSSNSIQKQTLNKDNRLASIKLVDDLKSQKQTIKKYHCTFDKLKKNATNLFNENVYSDDHFKLEQIKSSGTSGRKISVSRLKDIVKPGTPLFGEEISPRNKQKSQRLPHWPSWVAEMHILPFWHYETLIQPKYVNQVGFYHVVVWKDGRLIKETIDDTFYYDQISQKLYNKDIPVNNFKLFIWMHILIKTWAKLKGGYEKLQNDDPFDFIRTFSYPDWKAINPVLEDIEQMISYFNPIEKKEVIAVAQTKNDQNVGVFGLLPNSASYIIVGHYMQFEAIFVKIRSLTGAKWNKLKSSEFSAEPQEQISLQPDQFILPIKQFINLFHLVHFTSNKFFPQPQNIHYTRYSLNLDARETKAKMLLLEVNSPSNFTQSTMQKTQKQQQFMTNVTIYFPEVRAYDLGNKKKSQSQEMRQKLVIPWCKLMIGRQQETTNLQASFVQSMKQKMLQNQDGDFLYGKAAIQYQWIEGTYFKGYDTACCFLMRLKPGRYYLRFKIETLRVQYRSNINIVSATHVKISDPKLNKQEQQQFLQQMLSSKARLEKRNIGYLNPIKKGSWFICNDDFQSIGYGYLVIQTTKTSEYKIQLKVDPKKLKESGYRTKSKKDQNKYTLILEDGQGFVLVLKVQDGFQNKNLRVWPPEGIQITRLWRK